MLRGIHLPLVTPFLDGEVDVASLRRLVGHYRTTGIAGVVLLGTTGESPTISADEQRDLVAVVLEELGGTLPVHVGLAGNDTAHVVERLGRFEDLPVDGYLLVMPYYSRPGQDGLAAHVRAVARATDRTLILYNVPYRTGVNLANATLLSLAAELANVRAVKDSTGDIGQSLELLRLAPEGFAVLTGEDPLFFTSMANGAAGGILASAHLSTDAFVAVDELVRADRLAEARAAWRRVEGSIPLLFGEANPMPIKHCLWRQGLIASPECRLPLTSVSAGLAAQLDALVSASS
jgi:4-hydroxy-tetrahydrodipicolinate synthase